MKWYLNSGSANQLYAKQFFRKKLLEHNSKSLLIISGQSTKPAHEIKRRMLVGDPDLEKIATLTFFDPREYQEGKIKLNNFDALYIVGGEAKRWDENVVSPAGEKFILDLKQYLFRNEGCYFGSSWGFMIMFSSFHSEMELGEEANSFWYEKGLAIFTNVLAEVHYDESNNMVFLKSRHLATLKDHPEFKCGMMFSGDCVLEIDSTNIAIWKILSGRYEVNKYYPEL